MSKLFSAEMSYKHSPNYKLIEKFIDTGYDICKVEYDAEKYPKINNLAGSLTTTAKRYGHSHIRAIVYRGELFLINKLKG